MRGIDPNYQYTFKGYPKALYPPPMVVKDIAHEKRLRSEWKQPLPWTNAAEQKSRDEYWALQVYPKEMQPPHVTVQSPDEEAAVLGSWNVRKVKSHSDVWPHYMFHAKHGAKMVMSLADLQSLGNGWCDTPEQAIAIAAGIAPSKPQSVPTVVAKAPSTPKGRKVRSVLEPEMTPSESDPDKMNRPQMFAFLKERHIEARVPISNDELRARVRSALMAQTEAA